MSQRRRKTLFIGAFLFAAVVAASAITVWLTRSVKEPDKAFFRSRSPKGNCAVAVWRRSLSSGFFVTVTCDGNDVQLHPDPQYDADVEHYPPEFAEAWWSADGRYLGIIVAYSSRVLPRYGGRGRSVLYPYDITNKAPLEQSYLVYDGLRNVIAGKYRNLSAPNRLVLFPNVKATTNMYLCSSGEESIVEPLCWVTYRSAATAFAQLHSTSRP